jgi:hypothetical protein
LPPVLANAATMESPWMTHTCPEREPFVEMFLRLLSNFKLKQFMPVEVFESVVPEIQDNDYCAVHGSTLSTFILFSLCKEFSPTGLCCSVCSSHQIQPMYFLRELTSSLAHQLIKSLQAKGA